MLPVITSHHVCICMTKDRDESQVFSVYIHTIYICSFVDFVTICVLNEFLFLALFFFLTNCLLSQSQLEFYQIILARAQTRGQLNNIVFTQKKEKVNAVLENCICERFVLFRIQIRPRPLIFRPHFSAGQFSKLLPAQMRCPIINWQVFPSLPHTIGALED